MKKHIIPILIAAVLLIQIYSVAKIEKLQSALNDTNNRLTNMQNEQSSQLNSIYANIDAVLSKKSSIIESFTYSVGKLNREEYTVLITFDVIPKETSNRTSANLIISGERFEMERDGTEFIAAVPIHIFNPLSVKVIFEDNGVQKTESLDVPDNLRGSLLPFVYAHFQGESGTSFTKKDNATTGVYRYSGNLVVDVKPVVNNTILKIRLITEIDGVIVSEKPITSSNGLPMDINEEIALSAGQALTISVAATDSFGLIHTSVIDRIVIDENGDAVYGNEVAWVDEPTITDKDGKILYEPQI